MRLQTLHPALLLTLSTPTLAASSPSDPFSPSHTLQQRLSKPIPLNDTSYADLTRSPRDYSVAVLLTALEPKYQCGWCREFQPEWDLLGKIWAKGDRGGEGRVVLGTLDVKDGQRTFQAMGLQTAPIALLFRPTVGSDAKGDGTPLRFDFSTGTEKAEVLHTWLTRNLPTAPKPYPTFTRPTNYVKVATYTTAILGLVTLLAVTAPYLLPLLQSRNLWAAVSLIAILLFTSGHMFNHIRKVPYVAGDGKGGIQYFAPGFQSQFGMESQILAAIYGILSFATISLALKVPRMSDPRAQQIAVFVWGGVILLVYSWLLSVFRKKNGGYPFWVPPFV